MADTARGVEVTDDSSARELGMLIRNGDLVRRIEEHETPDTKTVLQLVGDSDHPGALIANAGDPMTVIVDRDNATTELRFPWAPSHWPRRERKAIVIRASQQSSTSTHRWKPTSAADR